MRVSTALRALALVAGVSCKSYRRVARRDNPVKPQEGVRNGATNKYIVEMEQGLGIGNIAKHMSPAHRFDDRYYKEFDCGDVFSGLSIETDSDNVDSLRDVPGVVNVWPMHSVPLASVAEKRIVSPESRKSNYTMHRMTGVQKLHAKGIRGRGATVAIIDTGINYKHKALGGCFGPGCKVRGGYDLVGAKWDAHQEKKFPKQPDDDPMDHYGHGSHVAGIIGADNEWLTGVAPDADLLIYKVFSDDPLDTDEEVLIQAFCDAYSAGADVITASIGRPNGFVDNPWALVASRLVERGVVVTISAGNEGYTGPFYSSSGSNGPGVLAVAAVNVTGLPNATAAESRPVAAYFSTWGPTNELILKPDIAGPGYDVVSTVLGQDFEEMTGTSMAAPYIAGVAALYIGHHGGREYLGPEIARTLAKRIASSGRNAVWSADEIRYNKTAPPFQVGTGLVDAWKVLHYDTQLIGDTFALLDAVNFKPNWSMGIQNNGNETITYTFELEPQGGIELLDPYYGIKTLFDIEPKSIAPKVKLQKPLKVQPGQTKMAEFEFELPDVSDDYLPLYGGKIWVKGDNGEKLSIPYGGAAYDTEKEFDSMFATEPYINEYHSNYTWSFDIKNDKFDFVELSARLRYPCVHLRWDIFLPYTDEHSWQLPIRPDDPNGYVGSATTYRDSDMYWYFDPKRMDPNDTISFPLTRVPRGYGNYWWFGKLGNGSYIRPGNYTMRFAALRPYGNANLSDHWDIMGGEAIPFEVLPKGNTTTNSTVLMRRAYR